MEISYEMETGSKYVKIRNGVVASTLEQTEWLFFDCDKDGKVLGVEILDASEHAVDLTIFKNHLIGFGYEENMSNPDSIMRKALSDDLVYQPSMSVLGQVQLVS